MMVGVPATPVAGLPQSGILTFGEQNLVLPLFLTPSNDMESKPP
jgi:hypothetical protein